MRDVLGPWIAAQRGTGATLTELRRIATGNSRAMWYAEFSDGDRFVIRVEQGGVFGTSGAEEYRFMLAAANLGCPVATVRWLEPSGDVIGQPFFVMDFIEGAATGRDDRTLAPVLARDFVQRLDELHRTDWSRELSTDVQPADATHAQIDRWAGVYRRSTRVPLPLLDEAAAWLHHHAPPLDRIAIVHGDPGPGNFVHDGERVVAFTDWEFTHLGDPMEDWAYLVSMRGSRTMAQNDWVTLFRQVANVTVSAADLRYWSVFNLYKGACANLTCLDVFATTNPAPNMAIIGTALHQTFMRQMAQLIGGDGDDQ